MQPVHHIWKYWRQRYLLGDEDARDVMLDIETMMMGRTTLVLSRSMRVIPFTRQRTFDPPDTN